MKPNYLSFLCVFFVFIGSSQCLMKPISLNERVNESSVIVEGKVISKYSQWNKTHTIIETHNLIQIERIFKGINTFSKIEVITLGGIVDDIKQVVNPSLDLSIGQTGVFTLIESDNKEGMLPYGSSQGFILVDKDTNLAKGVFEEYNSTETLFNEIEYIIGIKSKIKQINPINKDSNNTIKTPVVSDFNPKVLTNNTYNIITVKGENFGDSPGIIKFKNSNDNFFNTPANLIQSWTDSEIKLHMPENAKGGGFIIVNTNNQTSDISNLIFKINNNELPLQDGLLGVFRNNNGLGGDTFKYSTEFNANAEMVNSFENALNYWVSETGVNWRTDGVSDDFNFENVIHIENTSWDPSYGSVNSTTAICLTTYSGCSQSYGSDIIFNGIGFNFTFNNNPGFSDTDFYSIALHELGHAHNLDHSSNSSDVMYASYLELKRTLRFNDLTRACQVIQNSLSSCSPVMIPLYNSILYPYYEGFEINNLENTDLNVTQQPSDAISWASFTDPHANNNSSSCAFINCYNYDTNAGELDNLILGKIDLGNLSNPKLRFKVAYANVPDVNLYDELKVYISNNCSNDYGSPIYSKAGAELSTAGSSTDFFVPTDNNHWRTETIDLTPYINSTLTIKFEVLNKNGNNLYLDDITIEDLTEPIAQFKSDILITCDNNLTVNFTDTSNSFINSWAWDMDNDGVTDYTIQNPTHYYENPGAYSVSLTVTNELGTNTTTKVNYILVGGISAPATIDQETSVPIDIFGNPDDNTKWAKFNDPHFNGSSSSCYVMNMYDYETNSNELDYLYLPPIDLTNLTSPSFSFKVAYANFPDPNLYDELRVAVSSGCEGNFDLVYFKAGPDLATTDPLNQSYIPTDSNQWRTELIDLSSYAGLTVRIIFETTNKYGNNIYLDDFVFDNSSTLGETDYELINEISIFPNPNNGIVNIKLGTLSNVSVRVLNIIGQVIYHKENITDPTHQFELNGASGLYLLEIESNNERGRYKLIRN